MHTNSHETTTPNELFLKFQMILPSSSENEWNALYQLATDTVYKATKSEHTVALKKIYELAVHKTLYKIYLGKISTPWDKHWNNFDYYRYDQLRQILETYFLYEKDHKLSSLISNTRLNVTEFEEWAKYHCQNHRSNATHPLFDFLKNEATFEQLREFISQETPFDIHFGDILAKMLPGVHGLIKVEFSKNFWDEMGCGKLNSMHRESRLAMTNALNINPEFYLSNEDYFCLAELRLANMYFHAVFNRAQLPQAIGMMLATELMVPGRLELQILGWKRVGFAEQQMRYLIEHTTIDIEHADGWMSQVVIPILQKQPLLMPEIILGIVQRLEYAAEVCDDMLEYLPTIR